MPTDIPSVQIGGPTPLVTFTRFVGPLASIPDGESIIEIDTEAQFGIAVSDGSPYFDPQGAAPGEHARLFIDTSGSAYLDPA